MLSSGPRSYYDDYLRKKSTGRVVEDPTALLTDRNAYVNFLEVQLERVSAACLAVQSTEERFSDLTGMMQTLEQRCTANIKLVGLAQQCTEQVRAEFDRKFDILVKQQQDDREEFNRTLRQLTIQMTQQERKLEQYAPLQQRVTHCEKDITTLNDELSATKEQIFHLKEENAMLQQILEEERANRNLSQEQLVQSINSNQQKLLSLVDDHHLEQTRLYQESIDRFQELFNAQQESLIEAQQTHRRFVDSALQKQTDNIEQIQQDFVNRLNTHYSDLSQEMTLMKENIQEEINSSIGHSVESSAELKESIRSVISQTLDPICTEIFSNIDDRVSSESQRVLDEYIFLAQNFYNENDDSLVYPSAPAPSVAQYMGSPLSGVSPNRSNKEDENANKPTLPFPTELNRLNSVKSMKKSASEKSLGANSHVSYVPSYVSEGSPSRSINQEKIPAARQELDAIHNTLQALLSMHREDILSIHHRLDAMQVPLGVAPAKPLSRRNSVMKSLSGFGNEATPGNTLSRQSSMRSIDTNISALTIKSLQSTDSSKVSKKSVGSKNSIQSRKSVKSAASKSLDPEDVMLSSSSKLKKKKISKAVAQNKENEPSVMKKRAKESFVFDENENNQDENDIERQFSFAVSNEDNTSSKKGSKKHRDSGNAILDLSGDDSDSDYEDTVLPVELSGNMSFISNRSRSFISRDKSQQSLPVTAKSPHGSNRRLSSSLTRPTQASLQKHPSSSIPLTSVSYGSRSQLSTSTRSNSSDVKLIRRKMPGSSSLVIPSSSNSNHRNVSTNLSLDDTGIRSLGGQTRQLWKVNNTFVPSAAAANSTKSSVTKMSQRRKSTTNKAIAGDNNNQLSCHDCHHHHQFHAGVAHNNPTCSIKDTVLSIDECCRYCGKDMKQSKPSTTSTVTGKILF